jgi:hypothetical protein
MDTRRFGFSVRMESHKLACLKGDAGVTFTHRLGVSPVIPQGG